MTLVLLQSAASGRGPAGTATGRNNRAHVASPGSSRPATGHSGCSGTWTGTASYTFQRTTVEEVFDSETSSQRRQYDDSQHNGSEYSDSQYFGSQYGDNQCNIATSDKEATDTEGPQQCEEACAVGATPGDRERAKAAEDRPAVAADEPTVGEPAAIQGNEYPAEPEDANLRGEPQRVLC